MKYVRLLPALLVTLLAAGCVAPPPKAPPPSPTPAPSPPPPPPPASSDWRDFPLTPGTWSYRDGGATSEAAFGPAGAPAFLLRCDKALREIALLRPGMTTGNTMTLRTSFGDRNLPLSVRNDAGATVFTRLSATDPFLDNMVFSRGRFTVEVPGLPMLVIPSWAEPGRVVEDCRG